MNVQQVSPEAAKWIARRGMVLDYLNEQQPMNPGHNKRVAADLIHLMQVWAAIEQSDLNRCAAVIGTRKRCALGRDHLGRHAWEDR